MSVRRFTADPSSHADEEARTTMPHTPKLSPDASVRLLLDSQLESGAIPASTVHEVYQFGWLRDGSWCAYALDVAGHRDAASRWHHWVAKTQLRHEHRVDEALAAVRSGEVNGQVMMPARFTLDGHEETPNNEEEWPNFQTDCYGFWLWALADHVRRGGDLDDELEQGARLVIRYLMGVAEVPCFDCWEEHPGLVHTYSVAANAAGLRDAGKLLGDQAAQDYAARLAATICGPEHTLAGGFVRSAGGDTRVDGSLMWLAVPLNLVELTDEVFQVTLHRIVSELGVPGGGVRRYLGDSFYGGSQWLLLAATLGWCATATGQREMAAELLRWIETAADEHGYLPEQVAENVQSPIMLEYWRGKWGATATPLLWSHAMHVVLSDALA